MFRSISRLGLSFAAALVAIITGQSSISHAETVHSVTQISYDSQQRVQCRTVRMDPAVWASQSDACVPQLYGPNGPDRVTKTIYDEASQVVQERKAVGTSLEQAYASYAYSDNGKQTTVVDANGNRAEYKYDAFDRQEKWLFSSNTKPTAYNSSLSVVGYAQPTRINYYCYQTDSTGYSVNLIGSTCVSPGPGTAVGNNNTCPQGYQLIIGGYGPYCRAPDVTVPAFQELICPSGYYQTPSGYYQRGVSCGQAAALYTAGAANAADYEQYTYDANDNRTSLRKRDGSVLSYQYDAFNRVTLKVVPERAGLSVYHTRDVYYGYDNRGLQLWARFDNTSGEGVANTYDALGRIVSQWVVQAGLNKTLSYGYDANGNRTRLTHGDGVNFFYLYDGVDRMNGLLDGTGSGLLGLSYDAYGRLAKIDRTPGHHSLFSYDALSRLTGLTDNYIATTGNVTRTLGYNPANQIISRSTNNDAYGFTGNVNVSRAYVTNGLNQYTSAGPANFTYDANGNLTSDGSNTYVYDVENRLVSRSGAGSATLYYDPLGRLFETSSGTSGASGTTRFLHDGDELVGEYDGTAGSAGGLLRRYVHGPSADDPLLWYEGAGLNDRRSLQSDHQGSVTGIANTGGTLRNINAYDAYGIPQATNTGRFQYTGQAWLPELGMYYYKARIYSPTLGRFLQTDPIGYDDQVNLYAYVGNDPVNGRDPTGLCLEDACIGEGAVAACLASQACTAGAAAIGAGVVYYGGKLIQAIIGPSDPPKGIPASDRMVSRNDNGGPPDPKRQVVVPIPSSERSSLLRSERSLERNVVEHRQKLDEFRQNPDAADNQGRLAGARTPAERQQIIAGRERVIQQQITKNENELAKVRQRLKESQ